MTVIDQLGLGLPVLKSKDGKPALCLVTGATGYIGGRLVTALLEHGYRVRVLVRNASRISLHPWFSQVEVVDGGPRLFCQSHEQLWQKLVAQVVLQAAKTAHKGIEALSQQRISFELLGDFEGKEVCK